MKISRGDLKVLAILTTFVCSAVIISIYLKYYIFPLIFVGLLMAMMLLPNFYGAPWFPAERTIVRQMVDMAKIRDGDVVYDLGSGDARMLVEVNKRKKKNVKLTGIEISPFAVAVSKAFLKISGVSDKMEIRQQDLFKADLRNADVIFAFLSRKANDRLEKKLKRELKRGTRVVSHLWEFKNMKLVKADEKSKIYMYRT